MVCPLIDPYTGSPSKCVLVRVELIFALLFSIAGFANCLLFKGTIRGRITWRQWQCAALIGIIFIMTLPQTSAIGSLVALVLQLVQMGRAKVTPSLLSIWWLFTAVLSFLIAVDEYLNSKCPINLIKALCGSLGLWLSLPQEKSSDFDHSSLFSKINKSYMTGMMSVGLKSQITREDLPKPAGDLKAELNLKRLEAHLPGSLSWAILSSVGWKLTLILALQVSSQLITFSEPYLLKLFLSSLREWQVGESVALAPVYWLGIALGSLPLLATALENYSQLLADYNQTSSRTALTLLIYRKGMRLSQKARREFDSAKIMNLIDVDTDIAIQLADGTIYSGLIAAPIGFFVGFSQLWSIVGSTIFAGIAYYGFAGIALAFLFAFVPGWIKMMMAAKDKRVQLTTTTFRGMKSLKLYGWLEPYYEQVRDARAREIAIYRMISLINAILRGTFASSENFVAIMIFLGFLWKNLGALTPEIVFPTLQLLILIMIPFVLIPAAAANYFNARVSIKRIEELLAQDNMSLDNYTHSSEGCSVKLDRAVIDWEDTESLALDDITLMASDGELLCITGRVGCGKTAFLKAVCGEMHIRSGSVDVKGNIAYCAQQPWLQNTTIEKNILFGQELDPEWYAQVLAACDLVEDLESLPQKDQTEIGERGIILSGGQKARVALARAIYSRASVYVFDDVLSAVDEHVASHLITHVFSETGILCGSTILIATHNVRLLTYASKVVSLSRETICEIATLPEILASGEASPTYCLIRDFGSNKASLKGLSAHIRPKRSNTSSKSPLPFQKMDSIAVLVGQEEEERDQDVSLKIYQRFLSAVGSRNAILAFCFVIISSLLSNSIPLVLSAVSSHEFSSIGEAHSYVWLYVGVTILSGMAIIFQDYWVEVKVSLNAIQKLHDLMLHSLLHARMSFFDSTPVGRVLNRFSGGLEGIMSVGSFLADMILFSANFIFSLSTIVFTSPIEFLVVIPLVYLLNEFRKLYVSSSRQIRRMTAAANSPLLAQVEETIKGGTTVRAFNRDYLFEKQYDARVDYWIELNFVQEQISGWLSWRVDSLTAVLKITSSISLTWLLTRSRISVGLVGAALIFAERLGSLCGSFVGKFSQLEIRAVELQRIMEYIDVDQEAPAHIPETLPSSEWPSDGRVSLNELTVRYKPEGDDVLHKLSLSIARHEKVGVVGRTGAGKSTLSLAIFRLVEAAAGRIEIDGVDTKTLGLTDLRSRLSIIPQDSQIFSGTIRQNLDPNAAETDEVLWHTLEVCHLKEFFSTHQGLDTLLNDDGENLSQGQAQLVCLGRALLRPSQLLVLDEATASVDLETDQLVQQTIRSEFKNRTIITIAHRLETLEGYDRILVLDKGHIAEFDTPENLSKRKGLFWSLQQANRSE